MRSLSTLRWAVVAVLAALLVLPALAISTTGRTVVEVTGSSMSPTLHIGDVVIIRPLAVDDLRPGDIVTVEDGNGGYVTHRVLAVEPDGKIKLKGDANLFADSNAHDVTQILGVMDSVVTPPFGILLIQLQTWPLRISVLVTILGLAFLPLGAREARGRDESRADKPDPEDEADPVNDAVDFSADDLIFGTFR